MKRIFYKIAGPLRFIYWFIFRPKTFGVQCLVEHDGKLLMIRNSYGLKKSWAFPGGGIDKNETPEEATHRETREEVGIELSHLVSLGEYKNQSQYKKDTVYCFYGKAESNYFKIDTDEILEARWSTIDEIKTLPSKNVGKALNLYFNFIK